MDLRRPVAVVAAVAGLLAAAATATAAPNRTGEITADKPAFSWDGGPVTGTPVATVQDDDTFVKVAVDGKLNVVLSDADAQADDVDLYLFKATASGERQGTAIAKSEEGGSDEKISREVAAGNYVISVQGWTAFEGSYKGKATLTPTVPEAVPAPAPGPAPAPTADATPMAKLAALPKAKGRFTLKGTATDDLGVARVELAIVRTGKRCAQMTRTGGFTSLKKCTAPTTFLAAKGTKSWSLRLPKALAKGSYVVYARAIDSKGQRQAGFTPANSRAFKVR